MTRGQMIKNIRQRLNDEFNIELTKDQVSAVLSIEEDEVYAVIALMDSYKYVWGVVGGTENAPRRVAGLFSENTTVKSNYGWSKWKKGEPYVKFSPAARICEESTPDEYFAMPEHKYTTLARKFRKDAGIPEIDEYKDLSEDKILVLCKKADKIEDDKLTKGQLYRREQHKVSHRIEKIAKIRYWKEIGYIPMGCLYEEELGDDNYMGKQRDIVDYYLNKYLFSKEEELTPPERLDMVRNAEDVARFKYEYEEHEEEFEELKQKYLKQIQDLGMDEIEHQHCNWTGGEFNNRYHMMKKGKWKDPWGLVEIMDEREKLKTERLEEQRLRKIEKMKAEKEALQNINNNEEK